MSRLLASRMLQLSISRSNSISHGRKVLRCILPRSSSWISRLNCANTASLSGKESSISPMKLIGPDALNVNTTRFSGPGLIHLSEPGVDGPNLLPDFFAVGRLRLHRQVPLQVPPRGLKALQFHVNQPPLFQQTGQL